MKKIKRVLLSLVGVMALSFGVMGMGGSDVQALSHEFTGKIPNGKYYIISLQSGKALDAVANASGQHVIQWKFHGSTLQQWNIKSIGNNGDYTITSVATGKTLQVVSNSKVGGAKIATYTTSTSISQQWKMTKIGYNAYALTNAWSDMMLDKPDLLNDDGVIMQQGYRNLKEQQQWLLYPVAN